MSVDPARPDADVDPWFPPLPEPPPGGWLSDEPEMETYWHAMQQTVLVTTLHWLWRDRTDYFAAGSLTVYYSPQQKKSIDFRGPDFFVVLDVDGRPERNRDRKSWVVWEEGGKYPNVIIELLSDTTAKNDRGEKKQIYEQTFRTPEYYWFDPYSLEFAGFRLTGGRYEPIVPDASGRLASEQLGLLLGVVGRELRFFTASGELVAKPDEAAEQETRRADEEARRADEEARRADEETRRADEQARRADQQARRADEQAHRADEEARRADEAEAELARLRDELRKR